MVVRKTKAISQTRLRRPDKGTAELRRMSRMDGEKLVPASHHHESIMMMPTIPGPPSTYGSVVFTANYRG